MPKRHRRHVPVHVKHRHRHALPFNFASGLVYVVAVIVAIALGALFYRNIRQARKTFTPPGSTAEEVVSPDLPPGAKVITKSGRTDVVPAPAPAPTPARQPVSPPPPAAPEPAPTAVAQPEAAAPAAAVKPASEPEGPMPSLTPPPRSPWSPVITDRTGLQEVRILPTADTMVTVQPAASRELNNGPATELTMQGNNSIALAKFDVEKVRGWTVTKASWHACVKKGRPRAVGFSTVCADWTEGRGGGGGTGGATYLWADARTRPWTPDGAPLPHIVRGNAHSLFSVGTPDNTAADPGDWIEIPMDPAVVQALIAGNAYGLALSDEKGQMGVPVAFASREDTNASHFISIEGGLLDMTAPGEITRLRAHAHPALRGRDSVGVLLTWIAPGDDGKSGQAFSYDIRYVQAPGTFDKAKPLPLSRTPRPQPSGQPDQVVIEGLDPDAAYSFFVRALDESGQPGPAAGVDLVTPKALDLPLPPAAGMFDAGTVDLSARSLSVRVVDEAAATDPLTGRIQESISSTAAPAETKSAVWDRSSRTIRLRAARNETVGFLMVLEKQGAEFPPLAIKAQPLKSAKSSIPGNAMSFSRVWYTPSASARGRGAWQADALLPITDKLLLKSPPNPMPTQVTQAVYAELRVPQAAEPASYLGEIAFQRDDGTESSLNVLLDVLPVSLPERPRFQVELVVPASIGLLYRKDVSNKDEALPVEEAYQRMAFDHRCVAAFQTYSPSGVRIEPFTPPLSGTGLDAAVSSWAAWDARYGGYLSGAVFAGAGPVAQPVRHVLLPVFENWPALLDRSYTCADKDEGLAGGVRVYAGPSEDIFGCLDSDYWRAFRAVLQQFRDHLRARSWTSSAAHLWLVNVPTASYNGKAPPWALGEPRFRDDFTALESYAQIATTDLSSWPAGGFFFRVSVPDAAALAGYGLGRFSLLSVGDTDPAAWELLRDRQIADGAVLWLQSDTAPLGDTALDIELMAIRHFLEGADGWSLRETVGRPENWTRASPSALFYCGLPLGVDRPMPSLRLKALRRAQQDIDLLLLLQEKMSWTRGQLAEFAYRQVPALKGADSLACADLSALRHATQELLVK